MNKTFVYIGIGFLSAVIILSFIKVLLPLTITCLIAGLVLLGIGIFHKGTEDPKYTCNKQDNNDYKCEEDDKGTQTLEECQKSCPKKLSAQRSVPRETKQRCGETNEQIEQTKEQIEQTKEQSAETKEQSKEKGVRVISPEQLENRNEPTNVVFTMEGCFHCKKLKPVLDKLAEDMDIYEIRYDRSNASKILAMEVRGFPTIRKYDNKSGKHTEFKAARTAYNLREFFQ